MLVTGIKDGTESANSESVSEIPEEVKRTDAQRAYYDWLEVQEKVLNGNTDFSNIISNLNFDVKARHMEQNSYFQATAICQSTDCEITEA